MIDHLKGETNDIVTLVEAETRSAQIMTEDLRYHYRLALRMGDTFIGEATIKFKTRSN